MFDMLFDWIVRQIGVEPDYLALYLGLFVAVCNIVGKLIPESAVGWLGVVRKIAKVGGLYISQRITPGVTTTTISKAIAADVPDAMIRESASGLKDAVHTGTEAGMLAGAIVDSVRGRRPGEPFVEGVSPGQGTTVPDEFRTDGPFEKSKRARSKSSPTKGL